MEKAYFFCIIIISMLAPSCRDSTPPEIEICILNATGGAACVEPDGSHMLKLPSQMKNYWATNQSDQSRFASWCYDTDEITMKLLMNDTASKLEAVSQ